MFRGVTKFVSTFAVPTVIHFHRTNHKKTVLVLKSKEKRRGCCCHLGDNYVLLLIL